MEYLTAFLLGLAGSVHCAGMCGPLALAVPGLGLARSGFAATRVAYNLGRVLTYSLIGLLFGFVGQRIAMAGFQQWLALGLGTVLLLSLAVPPRVRARWAWSRGISFMVGRLKIGLGRTSIRSITLLGMLNGLLPCGLVYVASAGAAATGQTWHGGLYMLAFGLGTVPMMAAIGLSSRLIPVAVRGRLQKLVPLSIFLVGTLLILRGLALGIPGSPSADGLAACCAQK